MRFPKILKVAVVPSAGIFTVNFTHNKEYVITGGSERFFLEMMSKFLNFSYKIIVPKDKEWGTFKQGKWTGVIGEVSNRDADIGIGKISITEQRTTVTDFSYPYDIEDLTFAIPIPDLIPKTTALVKPFDKYMWFCLTIALIVLPIVFRFFQKTKQSTLYLILRFTGCLLQQPLNIVPKTRRSRIIIFSWLSFAKFISLCYSAAFLSYLTLPWHQSGISDIKQLSSAVSKGTHRCITFKGASYTSTMMQSRQGMVKILYDHIIKENWFVSPNKESVKNMLEDHRTAIIASRHYLESNLEGVDISKDSFFALTRSVVLQKKFCCRRIVDRFILRICAAGIYEKIMADNLFREQLSQKLSESSTNEFSFRSLSMENMSGAFLLLKCGYFTAIIVLILEVLSNKCLRLITKVLHISSMKS